MGQPSRTLPPGWEANVRQHSKERENAKEAQIKAQRKSAEQMMQELCENAKQVRENKRVSKLRIKLLKRIVSKYLFWVALVLVVAWLTTEQTTDFETMEYINSGIPKP